MASYSEVIRSFGFDEGVLSGRVADNWLQGRTLYGGMTAALCLEGALRSFEGLPPLRSAQIAFVGPAEGPLAVRASMLRQGRSVSFINADLSGDKGLAARAVFAFGAARPSEIEANFVAAPALPGAHAFEQLRANDETAAFALNFDRCHAQGGAFFSGSRDCDLYFWVRHRDRAATSIAALLALADMPPPAMVPMFSRPAPISTMTWSLNFLSDRPATDDGWWLIRSRAENAADGYSSQDMFVWNAKGEPVIAGRQSVAIFL
jgi:acyl-CoA thioesterase